MDEANGAQSEVLARAGSCKAMIGLVDRPREAMTYAAEHPRSWWVGALLALASLAILAVVSAPLNAQMAAEQVQARLALVEVPEEQMQQLSRFVREPSETSLILSGVGMGLVGLCLSWVLRATVLHFSAQVLGGESEFLPMFSVAVWSGFPSVLRNLAQAAFVLMAGQLVTNPGLSGLVATGDTLADSMNVVWVLLSSLDLFLLWHLILSATGLAVVSGLSRAKSGVVVLIWWAVSRGIALIPVLVGRGLMSGLGGA